MTNQSPWTIQAGDFPQAGSREEQSKFLLRYAVLAPSSHNSQPWRFRVSGHTIDLLVDHDRWLRVADADQRELYISAGCALENLLVAAEHFGLAGHVTYFPESLSASAVARVRFEPAGERSGLRQPELFDAIPHRHTHHGTYDGQPLRSDHARLLEAVAQEAGIDVHLSDEAALRRRVDELVVCADAEQFADPDWRAELGYWLGQGVFGTHWVMSKTAQLAVTYLNLSRSTAKKDTQLLDSASALGVVTAAEVGRREQVQVGQVFERMFLTATALGMAVQPVNQVLQVPATRETFEAALPDDWARPQLVFRVGYAEPEGHTPRRPLAEMID